MIVGEKVVKTQVLDCSSYPANRDRISPKLVLRVDGANLHRPQSAMVERCLIPGG
jgi:hypothetical protein